jgi:hypothetical protein
MAHEEKPSSFTRSQPPASGGPAPFGRPRGPQIAPLSSGLVTEPPPTPGATAKRAQAASFPSLPMGLIAGLVAAAIGAALWATITVLTNYQIGWMAIGVGALVGLAVRAAGKGGSATFGILGASLALTGCLVGNLLTGAVILSREWDVSLAVALSRLTPDLTVKVMTAIFNPMDLLFYALAIWQGYRLSIVKP